MTKIRREDFNFWLENNPLTFIADKGTDFVGGLEIETLRGMGVGMETEVRNSLQDSQCYSVSLNPDDIAIYRLHSDLIKGP